LLPPSVSASILILHLLIVPVNPTLHFFFQVAYFQSRLLTINGHKNIVKISLKSRKYEKNASLPVESGVSRGEGIIIEATLLLRPVLDGR